MYVCVCVCVHVQTHTLHVKTLGCEPWPKGRNETIERPEESRQTKSWHKCAQSTQMYIYAERWNEILD